MSSATRRSLDRLSRPLARREQGARLALAIGVGLAALGVAAWGSRLAVFRSTAWVPAAWAAAIALVALLGWLAWRSWDRYSVRNIAGILEQCGEWRAGSLRALLDHAAPGTSTGLLQHADAARGSEVARRGHAALEPVRRPLTRRLLLSSGALLGAILVLGSAEPWRAPASTLWHPFAALRDVTEPVRLTANRAEVARGEAVTLTLEAPGRRSAILRTRSAGEAWSDEQIALDSTGRASVVTRPLRTELHAQAVSGARSSRLLRVGVRLPAFLGALSVTAQYPAYLRLDDEPVPVSGDTILLPAGTRLLTRGEATAELRSAAWAREATVESLTVARKEFEGSFAPSGAGTYVLRLVTAGGGALGGDPVLLPIRVIADSVPVVDLPVPGRDTIAPPTLRLGLVVDARDDHGLTRLLVEARVTGRADVVLPLALPAGSPDRALLTYELDLEAFRLTPGDTLRYRAVAIDNRPGGQVGRSREYRVRIPTAQDLRDAQRQSIDAIRSRLDSLARRGAEVARQTSDLAQEQPRSAAGNSAEDPALSFEQAKRAEAAAAATEDMLQQAEQLRDAMATVEEAVKRAGLDDPEFARRLAEVREALEKAMTPELRAKLAELQKSLKALDANAARQSLEELARAQEQLREALERSRELLERAALEGEMSALADEARQLADQQRAWNEAADRADSNAAAVAEQALADAADSLAAGLKDVATQPAAAEAGDQMQQAADAAKQAAQQMRQAAQQMRQGDRSGARSSGKKAADMLQPIGDNVDQQRDSMQDQWREEVLKALDRALAETSRLLTQELHLADRLRLSEPPAPLRTEQGLIEEGVDRISQQMRVVAGKNALVSQQIVAALAVAAREMAQAREEVSSAAPNGRVAGERAGAATDALTTAAYLMVRSRDDVAGSGSGSGMAEAMQRMSQLAGQQGQVGDQSASLMPMLGQGQAGMQQQLARLAAQQRAISQQLERLQAEGGPSAAGPLAAEARELAQRLEAGRLDRNTVERQQRLFKRMLDAGRTLQGEERDDQKERQSQSATPGELRLPPALRARLLDENNRPRLPGWDELQRLSPEERRLVVDYFRVLTEAPR